MLNTLTNRKELANPRRILMTHYGNITDIVRSIPLLVALRHRFPCADVAWLISEQAAPLVLDHWAVNRFIVVRNDWFKNFSELHRIRERLQSFAPQVTVDPQNTFGSSLAAWLAGAKYRIGFGRKQSRWFDNVRIVTEEKHKIERSLQLLQPFGIYGSSVGFDIPECEKDRITIRNILQWKGLHGNFAQLHISADSTAARWQEERFGVVAKYLLEEWNLPSLITRSGYELELRRAESAVYDADGAASLAPGTTLSERGALSRLATIFVGADSAELQIAAAVGTMCVGLFGPTSALENAPLGQEHRMIQAKIGNDRKQQRRASLLGSMDAISPELVCEKCDEVLTEILRPSAIPMPQATPVQRKVA